MNTLFSILKQELLGLPIMTTEKGQISDLCSSPVLLVWGQWAGKHSHAQHSSKLSFVGKFFVFKKLVLKFCKRPYFPLLWGGRQSDIFRLEAPSKIFISKPPFPKAFLCGKFFYFSKISSEVLYPAIFSPTLGGSSK